MSEAMKIALYTDNTIPLPLDPICDLLNSVFNQIEFSVGKENLRIDVRISVPAIYENLPEGLIKEIAKYDYAFMCTNVPYENNYYFEGGDGCVLISFSGWNLYTELPLTNGFVYFICSLLTDLLDIGKTHDQNTGCINDFWWDKRGVDVGMRAAFICAKCLNKYTGDPQHLRDIRKMLDLISTASRSGSDIINLQPLSLDRTEPVFDVFLCHNSDDKPKIRDMNSVLQAAGITTWLDEERLPPGIPWQPELEKQITKIRSACVFVGANGRGPWQDIEIRAFLSEFANRGCPVIPIILEDAREIPDLPLFLKQMTWIDLRKEYHKNLSRLISALR